MVKIIAFDEEARRGLETGMNKLAAAARANRKTVEQHRETPLQHFGIGQARVRHVRLYHARAVKARPRARAAGDGFVILMTLIAESEIVHRALRCAHRA